MRTHNMFFFFLRNKKKISCGYTLEGLGDALLMCTHNICFYGEIRKLLLCC